MEINSKTQKYTFEGITRADVNQMLKYKAEKVDNDYKFKELESRLEDTVKLAEELKL